MFAAANDTDFHVFLLAETAMELNAEVLSSKKFHQTRTVSKVIKNNYYYYLLSDLENIYRIIWTEISSMNMK